MSGSLNISALICQKLSSPQYHHHRGVGHQFQTRIIIIFHSIWCYFQEANHSLSLSLFDLPFFFLNNIFFLTTNEEIIESLVPSVCFFFVYSFNVILKSARISKGKTTKTQQQTFLPFSLDVLQPSVNELVLLPNQLTTYTHTHTRNQGRKKEHPTKSVFTYDDCVFGGSPGELFVVVLSSRTRNNKKIRRFGRGSRRNL